MYKRIKEKVYKLLRKSEKWTQTDMVYLSKGGFWLSSNRIAGMLTSLVLAYFLANFISKTDYATYKYVLSIASILGISSLFGIDTATTRSVALGFEGTIKQGQKAKLKWSLIGLVFGIAISSYYFYKDNNVLGFSILIVALIAPILNSFLFGPFLEGKKLFKITSIYNIIKALVTTAILILIILFTNNILYLILGLYLNNLFFNIFYNYITNKKYIHNNNIDGEAINLGKHLSFINVLSDIVASADKLLLWHLFGPIQLAVYSFAVLPIDQIKTLFRPLSTLSLPKFANKNIDIIKKTLPKKILKVMFLLSIVVILYIIFSKYVYILIFPNYQNSIFFSQIFALSILAAPLRLIPSLFTAHAQKKELYILNITIPLIRLIFFIILIPLFGIMGAITALLLSSLAEGVISFTLLYKLKPAT